MSTRLVHQLREALENLAAPARDALAAAPEGSCKADELALELDDVMEAALQQCSFTDEAHHAVRAVGDLLKSMSGPENRNLWTEEAVYQDPRWQKVRECAARALESLEGS